MRNNQQFLVVVILAQPFDCPTRPFIKHLTSLHISRHLLEVNIGNLHARHAAPIYFTQQRRRIPFHFRPPVEQYLYGVGNTLQVAAHYRIKIIDAQQFAQLLRLLSAISGQRAGHVTLQQSCNVFLRLTMAHKTKAQS